MKSRYLTALILVLVAGVACWAWREHTVRLRPPARFANNPGVRAFFANRCVDCHTVTGVKGADGTVGPPLNGVATRAAHRVKGLSARAYLRQSILSPGAFVVPGFLNVMPSFAGKLKPVQLDALVNWLMTLRAAPRS